MRAKLGTLRACACTFTSKRNDPNGQLAIAHLGRAHRRNRSAKPKLPGARAPASRFPSRSLFVQKSAIVLRLPFVSKVSWSLMSSD
jgi:hypothetical protein